MYACTYRGNSSSPLDIFFHKNLLITSITWKQPNSFLLSIFKAHAAYFARSCKVYLGAANRQHVRLTRAPRAD